MCKKIGIAAVVVAVVLFLLNSTMLGSYTGTAWSKIHGSFKKQVPIEFEIERIKHEIAQLVPDMKKNLSSVAEEMVAIDNLKEDIRVTRERLATEKVSIMTMTEDLDKGATVVNYHGRDYSATRVREKLARDFASYQACEGEVKNKEKLLDLKERGLDAAREQLQRGMDLHETVFGVRPHGVWPSEGSVSEEVIAIAVCVAAKAASVTIFIVTGAAAESSRPSVAT